MSKQYEKSLRQIRNEFSAMGITRVTLWVYPTKNPSKIVAIGSCVPAYIGCHMLRKAIEYSGGVNSLAHQGFFSSNWIGVGTSLFAESSFRPVTKDQLTKLMDTSPDTQKFQAAYRQLTMQQKKGKGIWSFVGQSETLRESLVTPYKSNRVRKSFVLFFVPIRESIDIKNNLSFTTPRFRSPCGISCPRRKNRI